MKRQLPQIIRLVVFTCALGGCSAFSDPAVRMTRCIREAAKTVDETGAVVVADCNPRSPVPFTVVLHPAREVPDFELIVAGLPPDLVDNLRSLRLGEGDGIYVIPHGRGRPSRASVGWRQAVVPEVLVASKPAGGRVEVVVREGAYGVAVVEMQ